MLSWIHVAILYHWSTMSSSIVVITCTYKHLPLLGKWHMLSNSMSSKHGISMHWGLNKADSKWHFQMKFLEIFLVLFFIETPYNFVPRAAIYNKPSLVEVMAWHRIRNIGSGNGLVPSGNKPLPGLMLTEIYVSHHMHQITRPQWVDTLRPRLNGWHFADDIFKCIFLNENLF